MIKTRLILKNIGPIKQADIIIRPLTIIIGRNNTGKSYFAMIYYGLMKAISKSPVVVIPIAKEHLIKKIKEKKIANEHELIQVSLDTINELLIRLSNQKNSIELIKEEIERVFGMNIGELMRNKKLDFTMDLILKSGYGKLKVSLYTINEELHGDIRYMVDKSMLYKKIGDPTNKSKIIDAVFEPIERIREYLILQNIFFMPASRAGILHSYRTIASSIISSAPLLAVRGASIPKIPGVLADFLSQLITMEPSGLSMEIQRFFEELIYKTLKIPIEEIKEKKRSSKNDELVKKLESEIFEGEIVLVKRSRTGPAEPIYKFDNVEIDLANASSMIAELSPLDLFIKYGLVNENDILIIEEPEAHLHPDKQVKVAELLAMLVNVGKLNLIITTHSDIILSKLSNLVKLSYLPKSEIGKEKELLALKPSKIAVYHFKKTTDGVVAEKVKVSKEGISDQVFYDIIRDLYEESLDIYYRIESLRTKK